jgi:hypothetical protein
MSEVRMIRLIQHEPTSSVRLFFNQLMFWGFLVGTEGFSRMWFGGSWVVDVMLIVVVIVWGITMSVRATGVEVNMTTAEIRRWVAAGTPRDVKEWRRAEKERLSA